MKINKALLVYKKSAYEAYFMEYKRKHFATLSKSGDIGLQHIRRAHEAHYESLGFVESTLKKLRIRYVRAFRGGRFNEKAFDLIISVGGDGTFLDAAKNVFSKFILGVNSDLGHSVGKFCYASKSTFQNVLSRILKSRFEWVSINRLKISINGKQLATPILNDLLICHSCPAAMSHYILEIYGKKERQRSSGMWVSTAAGSTGGIKSAGGQVLNDESRRVQYIPRELYKGRVSKYFLKGGILQAGQPFKVHSQMQEGAIYMDGAHRKLPFKYGDILTVVNSDKPLKVIKFKD